MAKRERGAAGLVAAAALVLCSGVPGLRGAEKSAPDDELYFATIDAINEEEPRLIREMIERLRPNSHFVLHCHVAAVVGTHIGPGTAAFAMIAE